MLLGLLLLERDVSDSSFGYFAVLLETRLLPRLLPVSVLIVLEHIKASLALLALLPAILLDYILLILQMLSLGCIIHANELLALAMRDASAAQVPRRRVCRAHVDLVWIILEVRGVVSVLGLVDKLEL